MFFMPVRFRTIAAVNETIIPAYLEVFWNSSSLKNPDAYISLRSILTCKINVSGGCDIYHSAEHEPCLNQAVKTFRL